VNGPPTPEHDEELLQQIAHLDALEQAPPAAGSPTADPGGPAGEAVQPLWPASLPAAPTPAASGSGVGAYLGWLQAASDALRLRVAENLEELSRLDAQWAHVVPNLSWLRPEEIAGVVEAQIRARERIAADAALDHVVGLELAHLGEWNQTLGGPLTDPALVRRLLDDVVAERAAIAAEVIEIAVDTLSGLSLDLDVVQRQVGRDPGSAAGALAALRERLTRSAESLRDASPAVEIRPQPGEPLAATLQRCLDRVRGRVQVRLGWTGPEVRDAEAAAAIPWVLQECLHHLAGQPGRQTVEVGVDVGDGGGVAVRIAAASAALLPDGDPAWLVRSRARVAVGGGRLLCGQAGEGSFVEARFGLSGR
jgi:hypothetical protein